MTANKHFKRRVRERARRTGESCTAALSHLRRIESEEQQVRWQRIEKADFGYAVHLPQQWEERPADLRNSPWETARFVERADRRHSLIVFRRPVRRGGGRVWAVREYFVLRDGVCFCLGCGSSVPEEDASLFEAVAERLELIGDLTATGAPPLE